MTSLRLLDLPPALQQRMLGMLLPRFPRGPPAGERVFAYDDACRYVASGYYLASLARTCPTLRTLVASVRARIVGAALLSSLETDEFVDLRLDGDDGARASGEPDPKRRRFRRSLSAGDTSSNAAMQLYLRRNGLTVSGTKKQLWRRIQQFQRDALPSKLSVKVRQVRRCIFNNLAGAVPRACRLACRRNKVVVLLALRHGPKGDSHAYSFARRGPYAALRNDLTGDRDVVRAAVRRNGLNLHFAPRHMKDNAEVVLAAVRQNGRAIWAASKRRRNDYDIILAAAASFGGALAATDSYRNKDDERLAWACLKADASIAYHTLSRRLKMDEDIIRYALKRQGRLLQSLPTTKLRFSQRNVLLAAESFPAIVTTLPDIFLSHEPLARIVAAAQPSLLKLFHSNVLENLDVARIAVKKDGLALGYFSESVRNNREICVEAVKNDGFARLHVGAGHFRDPEIASISAMSDPMSVYILEEK